MGGTFFTSADIPSIPNLVGNWTGVSYGHDKIDGYDGPSNWEFLLSITEQKKRAFNGTITFAQKNNPESGQTVGFSGVIGPDMKTIYLSEYNDGLSFGQIIDPDTMEIIYLKTGDYASAAIDTFTRKT